ncbi:MAG: YfhO family protein, partial [Bryobacteraceae bacterium]
AHAWFVVALGLALAASAGAAWLARRWDWAPAAIAALLFVDVCYFNSIENPLAYARASFDELYGSKLDIAQRKVASSQTPLTRFHAPARLNALGPMNHPLDLKLETTYGYNPLSLAYYSDYLDAARKNPKLLDGLGVSRVLEPEKRAVYANPEGLPRAYFARSVVRSAALDSLDPHKQTLVEAGAPVDPAGAATIVAHDEQSLRIKYTSRTGGLVRVSIPFFPGWEATVDGAACPLLRADHALLGVVVPPGEKELRLRFRPRRFGPGAGISAAGVAAFLVLLWLSRRVARPAPSQKT